MYYIIVTLNSDIVTDHTECFSFSQRSHLSPCLQSSNIPNRSISGHRLSALNAGEFHSDPLCNENHFPHKGTRCLAIVCLYQYMQECVGENMH